VGCWCDGAAAAEVIAAVDAAGHVFELLRHPTVARRQGTWFVSPLQPVPSLPTKCGKPVPPPVSVRCGCAESRTTSWHGRHV
jgi:hypothetical protein